MRKRRIGLPILLSLLILLLQEMLFLPSLSSATSLETQDVWMSGFDRQAYRNQNGNSGGFEVEAPERLAMGSPVSVRLLYEADPHQGAVPFHAEVTWGSGFKAGSYSIQLTSEIFSFMTTDTRTFAATRPEFSGGSYTSPTTGRLDLFEMFEVAALTDLWIKFRIVDEKGIILEDEAYDWSNLTTEGTDVYEVTPDSDEIRLDLYVGLSKDDETVSEEEMDQARQMMASGAHDVTFSISTGGGGVLHASATQTVSQADYDPQQAADEAAAYNLYVSSYGKIIGAALNGGTGTVTLKSSLFGGPYLTEHVWQHMFMGAYMAYPNTSIVRTLPVAPATPLPSAEPVPAIPGETPVAGLEEEAEPEPDEDSHPLLPIAAAGAAGTGALGLMGALIAALHARDYAALKPILQQLAKHGGSVGAGTLTVQQLAAPSGEAAASQVAKAASKRFLPFLYLRFHRHTFLLRREIGDTGEGELMRRVKLRFRSEVAVRLNLKREVDALKENGGKEELRIRHPRKAMRGKRNVDIVYLYDEQDMRRDHIPDEKSFQPVTIITHISALDQEGA